MTVLFWHVLSASCRNCAQKKEELLSSQGLSLEGEEE